MSVHVLLVRHGQSAWNHERRLTGWTDVPLSDLGREQARALRPRLEALGHTWAGVWSSDLQRAAETARLAWGPARPDVRLRELDFGDLEGARWDELDPSVVASFRSVEGLAAPGGESFIDLRRRVEAFLDELPVGRHLVFCHGGVIRSVASPLGLQGFVGNVATVELDWTARALGAVDAGA